MGFDVGLAVGFVGYTVGDALGLKEGDTVGVVGLIVGILVGLLVGFIVGPAEGLAVGAREGEQLACRMLMTTQIRQTNCAYIFYRYTVNVKKLSEKQRNRTRSRDEVSSAKLKLKIILCSSNFAGKLSHLTLSYHEKTQNKLAVGNDLKPTLFLVCSASH